MARTRRGRGGRRHPGSCRRRARVATVLVGATLAAVPLGAGTAGAATTGPTHAVATAGCPAAPPAPPHSTNFRLSGPRWNPARTISWTLDTRNLAHPAAEVADWRRAFRDADRWTNLRFAYRGEVTRIRTAPARFSIQIRYVSSGRDYGQQRQTIVSAPGDLAEVTDAVVSIKSTLRPGFGPFDRAAPGRSREGGVVLHELGSILGLADLPASAPAAVMSPSIDAEHDFSDFQAGDANGLARVGAAAGCRSFRY